MLLPVYGDGRGFDPSATLSESRAVLVIDLETGAVSGAFSSSCRATVNPLAGKTCNSADPTSIVTSNSELGFSDISTPNGFAISQTGSDITVHIEGVISVGPPSPPINGVVVLTTDVSGLVTATKTGDGFPAYEIYQDVGGERVTVDQFDAGFPHRLFGDGEPG